MPLRLVPDADRGAELSDLESAIAARLRQRAALDRELARRHRDLDDADRELDLLHRELTGLESAIARRRSELAELGAGGDSDGDRFQRVALANDLLAARHLVADRLVRSADLDEARTMLRQVGLTLVRAADDGPAWAHLDRLARRAEALSPRERARLRVAADADWSPLLQALGGSPSSLDALTLNRDVAIGLGAMERVDAGAVRARLRELAGPRRTAALDRDGLLELGRVLVFVMTRMRLLFGLAGLRDAVVRQVAPEVGEVRAVVTGALLRGLARAVQPADGQVRGPAAVPGPTGAELGELARRWEELAEAAPDDLVESTRAVLDVQVASLYLAYEATMAAPDGDRAVQASCDDLLAALRAARAHLPTLDPRRVSQLLRRCQSISAARPSSRRARPNSNSSSRLNSYSWDR